MQGDDSIIDSDEHNDNVEEGIGLFGMKFPTPLLMSRASVLTQKRRELHKNEFINFRTRLLKSNNTENSDKPSDDILYMVSIPSVLYL